MKTPISDRDTERRLEAFQCKPAQMSLFPPQYQYGILTPAKENINQPVRNATSVHHDFDSDLMEKSFENVGGVARTDFKVSKFSKFNENFQKSGGKSNKKKQKKCSYLKKSLTKASVACNKNLQIHDVKSI